MFENEFYPTPKELVNEMLNKVDFSKYGNFLEPSAGKGDIAKAIQLKLEQKFNKRYMRNTESYAYEHIDVIEVDTALQHILKGEKFRLVHNDFLSYSSQKSYDAIIMNPPFSNGDKHLLKALSMIQDGGMVVCLLNAETLLNPYTNTRKDLVRKLDEMNAEVDYLQNSFANAERKTDVEVALITVKIDKKQDDSIIIEHLRQMEDVKENDFIAESSELITNDFIKNIVDQYNHEIQSGKAFIKEFFVMQPYLLKEFNEQFDRSILSLDIDGNKAEGYSMAVNKFIETVRSKYWKALFNSKEFSKLFTTELRRKFHDKLDELKHYDFSLFNIYQLQQDVSSMLVESVEDTIIRLFDEFSYQYSYLDEKSKNIHYYDGWKTNKAHKINHKVITRLNAYSSWNGGYDPDYNVKEKLSDIEKALSYLASKPIDHSLLNERLHTSRLTGTTRKIQLEYFTVSFFKKGTCHIEFTDMDLLKKFNLYGSQKKGWLPPVYGHKKYNEMNRDEMSVIDAYEGKESYEDAIQRRDYFFYEPSKSIGMSESLVQIGYS